VILQCWAKSDIGRQRVSNEDCHYVNEAKGLVLVLDGMGGHRAGEVASSMAMDSITEFFLAHADETDTASDIFESYDYSFSFRANLLRQATFLANRVVVQKSLEDPELAGMGSTLTALSYSGFTVSIINVGDSRVYLIREGTIEQISRDHTLAEDQVERGIMSREEARETQLRHILSSVIGVDSRVRIHMDELAAFPGDVFLLCSDGLTAVMDDWEILDFATRRQPGPDLLELIIEEVNRRGGPDNTTLALAYFSDDGNAAGDEADEGSSDES
jgi:PPM family protein phosphatase